jgi:hypothetical protein
MVFTATFPLCAQQSDGFEYIQVLRDRLTGERKFVLHRQTRAKLEQRLPVALVQFVEDRTSRRGCERIEEVCHTCE